MTAVALDYRAHLRKRLGQTLVPESLHTGLVEYIAARRPMGQLLTAVVKNDLKEACVRADVHNRAFLFEIVPALAHGGGVAAPASATGPAPGGLLAAMARVPLFYGWGFPALAVAGLVLVRGQADAPARNAVTAYGLAFVALVLMRGLGGGLFRDLKEITFVGPLVAVTAGASLETLARRGRRGWIAVVLLAVGLLGFWAERYRFYFSTYDSAVMRPVSAAGVIAPAAGGAGSPGR